MQAYDLAGADGLVSKKRGRPSNRRHSEDFRNLVLDLVREHYADFGPTLAAEKLLERNRIAGRTCYVVSFGRVPCCNIV